MGGLEAAAFHVADTGPVGAVAFHRERTYSYGAVREDGIHMAAEGYVVIGVIRVGDDQWFGAVRTAVNPFYPPHGADKIFCQVICDFINSGKILRVTVNIDQILQIFHVLFDVVGCHVRLHSFAVSHRSLKRYENAFIIYHVFVTKRKIS